MKAIVYEKYDLPDILQFKDVEKPVPMEDEVLLKELQLTRVYLDKSLRKGDKK